ncbi:MAG: class I SAM-dependent methyltransferase [Oscillatoria sp. SIO1A7]|nr:class I SAM-dependent methyltransferase [Oscillatoria sp. SIO1A7]
MINEYVEIVEYYDNLLTSGYFDYDDLANTLYKLLGDKRKVLDIGVGTGLLTEKMLPLADYDIVGVDFSSGMLDIAKERLANSNVKLICQDILEFETEEKFEAIVSTGGAITIVEEDQQYKLYSHITDRTKNEQLLVQLYNLLDDNGLFTLKIQGSHTNYKKEIKDGIFYEQKLEKGKPFVDKWYIFSTADGQVLKEQFCHYYCWDGEEASQAFSDAGFKGEPHVFDDEFLVFYK